MIQISKKVLEIDNERKKDIIERVHEINLQVNFMYNSNTSALFQLDSMTRIDKALYLYRKKYKDDFLNDNEKALFAIYVIFEDDERFLKLCRSCNYDHKKVGSYYSLNEICSYLRYKNLMMMRRFDNTNTDDQYVLTNKKNK